MVTKLKIVVLIFILTCSMATTCKKNCIPANYSFSIAAKAFPDLDSINVGDTVWIQLDEPSTFLDFESNKMVSYNGAQNLGTAIGFRELLGNSESREAANDFNFKLVLGREIANTNPQLIREYVFPEQNNRYVFKLAIVPRRMGIFRISLSSAANVYRHNDPCSKASFALNFKETNQHLYFNEWNYGVVVPLPNNGYCFKVK